MKKNLFIILVAFLMMIGLTGCYTELYLSNANLASESTTVIIYPVPSNPYIPPSPPPPAWVPQTPVNNPGKKDDAKRTETTLRNDNGGRGNDSRDVLTTPQRGRIEPANNSGSALNTPRNSNGGRAESPNSGNNSSPRSGDNNNSTERNSNGNRNTSGGR